MGNASGSVMVRGGCFVVQRGRAATASMTER